MTKQVFSPATIAAPFGAYSHGAVVNTPGRWLFTSGQLAISKGGAIPESVLEQARLCFENVRKILAEGGMQPADVVRICAFVTDVSTLLIVSGFTRPEFKVEVEVTAFAAPNR